MLRKIAPAAFASLIAALAKAQAPTFVPEFQVNTYTAGNQIASSVAIDPAGEFVVVWTSFGQDGSSAGVFGQKFDSAGSRQGGEFQVNSTTSNAQFYPGVGMDSTGNFIVVWDSRNQDGSGDGIVGRRFDSLGAPISSEFLVNTYTTGLQFGPSVAVQGSGNFVVVWKGNGQVYGRRYDPTGTPLGNQFVVNTSPAAILTTEAKSATVEPKAAEMSGDEGPTVAVDPLGNFIVVWTTLSDGSGNGVKARRYDSNGSAQGDEFLVNTYTTSRQNRPFVGVGSSGNFVIVWTSFQQDGSMDGVFAQRYDTAGAPQGGEFQVNTSTPGYQLYPSVGIDSSDHFIVVWQSLSTSGDNLGVLGRRYDSTGAPEGPEFQINTYSNYSTYPMVAMNNSGNFVVAWSAYGEDNSGYGIFATLPGNPTPSPTASLTPTPTSTGTVTAASTPTNTPSNTFTPTFTPSNTPSSTFTPTQTGTFTPTFTATSAPPTATKTPTSAPPTATKTATAVPPTATATRTATPSLSVVFDARFPSGGSWGGESLPTGGVSTPKTITIGATANYLTTGYAATVAALGITANGIPMQRLVSSTNGALIAEIWGLPNPPTGAVNVQLAFPAVAVKYVDGLVSYSGVAGVGASQIASGSGMSSSVTLASNSGNRVVDVLAKSGAAASEHVSGVGQTLRWKNTTGAAIQGGAGSDTTGAASVSPSWVFAGSGSYNWAAAAVELISVGNGMPAVTPTATQTPTITNTFTPTPTPTPAPPGSPVASSVAPGSGPAVGGAGMTLNGANFVSGATAMIGGVVATGVTIPNTTQLLAVVPALPAGTLSDIKVTNPNGQSGTLPNGWLADFLDVAHDDAFHDSVECVFRRGITAGCGNGLYCRDNSVTRSQMAVFLLKSMHGSTYQPPACAGVFGDVACPSPFAAWIERLAAEGITGGCGGGNFCPDTPVTRAQMAVFLLKAEHGSTFQPPACTGVFGDVACPSPFASWIERLAAEGITGGCGNGNYCPANVSTRGQMAVFMVKAFGFGSTLQTPGERLPSPQTLKPRS